MMLAGAVGAAKAAWLDELLAASSVLEDAFALAGLGVADSPVPALEAALAVSKSPAWLTGELQACLALSLAHINRRSMSANPLIHQSAPAPSIVLDLHMLITQGTQHCQVIALPGHSRRVRMAHTCGTDMPGLPAECAIAAPSSF